MLYIFKNLFHVLSRFKVSGSLNLFGLSVAFTAFLVVLTYVRFEYRYDRFNENNSLIYQLENMRDDNIWEANFSRPFLEEIIASSPHITGSGIYMQIAYSQFTLAVSASSDPNTVGFVEKLERVTPGFTDIFTFEMVQGSKESLGQPNNVLIPQSMAGKLFGEGQIVGRPLYLTEIMSLGETFQIYDLDFNTAQTIGGVYRDFPENSRLKNVIYLSIPEKEMIHDWNKGSYYAFLRLNSRKSTDEIIENFKVNNARLLSNMNIEDIRLRPLDELYFTEKTRADSAPSGNKLVTDTLLLIVFLVVIIASINFVNFSIALTPLRIRNINTRKVLGHSVSSLRRNLTLEAIFITMTAFVISLFFTWTIAESKMLNDLLGFTFEFSSIFALVGVTAVLALVVGIIAGLYPAWYMTSFPTAMVLSGSFAISGRAKNIRKFLVGFQYVISITLIVCALFINIQNRYLETYQMGFDTDNILEVKLSWGTAFTKSEVYKEKLMQNSAIEDVAFTERPFVQDGGRAFIAYNFNDARHYMNWVEASYNLPSLMRVEIIEGRDFLPGDEYRDDDKAVCIINETSARDMGAIAGDFFYDNDDKVEIVGIFRDMNFESLYQPVKPLGFFTSAKGHYRRYSPAIYSYIRISPGDPQNAIAHINATLKEIDPAFPSQISFLDRNIDRLYLKSHNQGLMVTLFSILAVLLSIVGVFGLVVFESQGRRREIAIRRVMGATIQEILAMFNTGFIKIVLVCFVIAAPFAWYGVNIWLGTFAYKAPIQAWVFLVALLMVLILTILTVTFQSYRVATANPAKYVKTE